MTLPRPHGRNHPRDQAIPISPILLADEARLDSQYIRPIAEILHELDSIFLESSRRATTLKEAKDYYNEWKSRILITEEDVKEFSALVATYDDAKPRASINDLRVLKFWRASMDFMVFERDGFPGKMVLGGGREGGYVPYPKPHTRISGWPTGISPISTTAGRLPHAITRAAEGTLLIQGSVFQGLQARVSALDAFLGDTYYSINTNDVWISIGARIDNSWPPTRDQEGPFGANTVAISKASPTRAGYGPNPLITLLVSTFPVISAFFAARGAWKVPQEKGTPDDPDFYLLVSNSLMGWLSILTLMIPTIQDTKIAKLPWRITWLLAVVSFVADGVAVPLYLNYPPRWSVLVAFGGSVFQAIITLQLMYTVSGRA